MRIGRQKVRGRTARQCAKKKALPLLTALLCFASAMPAAARHHGGAPLTLSAPNTAPQSNSPAPQPSSSGGAKTNKKGGLVGAGFSVCRLDANNIDFGKIASISDEVLNIPGTITFRCLAITTSTKFCIMLYPNSSYEPQGWRVLWGKVVPGLGRAMARFQFVINQADWGAGKINNDYGYPYYSSTGFMVIGTHFPISYTAKMDLRGQLGFDMPVGDYSNTYHIKMIYSDNTFWNQPQDLCDPSTNTGVLSLYGSSEEDINVKATLMPACGLITGGDLDFPKQYRLTAPIEAHSSLTVKCTGGFSYTVAANAGLHPDSVGTNAMQCATPDTCGTSTVQYLLYDDKDNIWNSQRENPYVQKGTMSASGRDTYNLTARTIARASSPPAGTYTDTIIFTLTPTVNP